MTYDLPSTLPSQAVHLLVLRALLSNGFESASHQATLTFSSVLSRYLGVLGQASLDNAQDSGRRIVGVHDVVEAIESIGGMGLGGMREVLEDDLEREEGRLMFDGMDRLASESNSQEMYSSSLIAELMRSTCGWQNKLVMVFPHSMSWRNTNTNRSRPALLSLLLAHRHLAGAAQR